MIRYDLIRFDNLPLLAAACLLAVGCGSDPKPEPMTPAPTGPPPTANNNMAANAPTANAASNPNASGVMVDEKIRKMCQIPEARFDFDSSAVSPSAKKALDALAKCFISGAAAGKGMRIVGHADPRGETEYNFGLGQQRAGSIAGYLTNAGLGKDKIATSSRGELEASGSDEDTWARDRRVEIFLAE
jgi:peptidoglycan-associated lipoprotein